MCRALSLGLLAFLVALPLTAMAQDPRLQAAPVAPHAAPASGVPPAAADRDAERGAEEPPAQERGVEGPREQGGPAVPPARLPALDQDLVGGIQTRALGRALGH